ncbi:hypothetical protein ASPNIDRAFT_39760 [Aspergillus niger ATCC 1015]|uniref:Uncharacterized protein n=1 Tax=Aspergillus niger (strain ATCC 1015 / CBS 113.46 / FGSC A1144 / LSHB Ac4 / NCTC 3858a / NRRL 328 / USDA 3528.7) TaxID=380704 RepID=G3XZ98_ASPNA|nr:hypothetical protein ASPNIDRAFT_39760 [Aspergillus niger ATCC 1015]
MDLPYGFKGARVPWLTVSALMAALTIDWVGVALTFTGLIGARPESGHWTEGRRGEEAKCLTCEDSSDKVVPVGIVVGMCLHPVVQRSPVNASPPSKTELAHLLLNCGWGLILQDVGYRLCNVFRRPSATNVAAGERSGHPPCCKFATIVLAVELRCDLFGAVASIRSMGPVCLGADSARLLRTLSELPGLSLAFSQSVEVAPRMNHGERRRSARAKTFKLRKKICARLPRSLTHGRAISSIEFHRTTVGKLPSSIPSRAGESNSHLPTDSHCTDEWQCTKAILSLSRAMIRQKVCRTRGNGSSCPKPLTFFVVELKIRPEREKYASPPPLPDWGGWDQKDDTSTSSTKCIVLILFLFFPFLLLQVEHKCAFLATRLRQAKTLVVAIARLGLGGGGKVEKASRLAIVGE